jgi:hypothetical protein
MVAWTPIALTLTGLGLGTLFIPFLFPVGCLLWFLAAWPYYRWLSKKIKADIEYANRDKPLEEGSRGPWEEGQIDISDDELLQIVIHGTGRGSRT